MRILYAPDDTHAVRVYHQVTTNTRSAQIVFSLRIIFYYSRIVCKVIQKHQQIDHRFHSEN